MASKTASKTPPVKKPAVPKSEVAQSHLAAIVESSDDAIISASLDGVITSWNRGAAKIFGYSAEEIIGQPTAVLISENRLSEERRILKRAAKGEGINHYETFRKRKDGAEIAILLTVSPIRNSAGDVVGISKVAKDISGRLRAEEALRDETRILDLLNKTGRAIASKLDLQSVVQTVTDAATELSAAKFGAFFYNVIGPQGDAYQLYTLSGAPREAFEKFGMPRATGLFGPTFRGEASLRSDDVLKDPRYGLMPPHYGMPKGHLPVRSFLSVPVISRSGEVLGGLFFGHPDRGIFTERTERIIQGVAAQAAIAIDNARLYESRKQAEKALRAAQAELKDHAQHLEGLVARRTEHLREAVQSLEGVCYTLAHDLRAPLRAIQGLTKIILEDYSPAFDEPGREVAGRIVTSASRMDLLIRDLLEYARLSHAELPCSEIDLNLTLSKVAAIATEEAATRPECIRLGPLPKVWANETLLEQVFTNLLSNSLKFARPGVKPEVSVTAERVPDYWRIILRDNGIGIEPRYHERVFGIFQRLLTEYPGTGVGLAIVKKGVERMNGRVGILSIEGPGACFYVDLRFDGKSFPPSPL
ncbi:MAG TPA: PAS domain S-box protein [Verrucomicrobiae bacterium]|nr:PAS domain S-box protein [Verrucomicrobiae bacterium]